MTVEVRPSLDAWHQIDRADAWWREHRPEAPDLFLDELVRATELLTTAPEMGTPFRRDRTDVIRRVLLPVTRYAVYYVHDAEAAAVFVLAVWSAVRGRPPPLPKR